MPTIAHVPHGKVTALWGTAFIRTPSGKLRLLKLGDVVRQGDVILTSQDGIVQISDDQGAWAPRLAELEPARGSKKSAAIDELEKVIESLNQGDPSVAPAAGLNGGDGSDLQPGLRVDRVIEVVSTQQFAFTETTRVAPSLVAGSNAIAGFQTPAADVGPGPFIGAEDSRIPITLVTSTSAAASITVTSLPAGSALFLADGVTPVVVGQTLTPAQAAGLVFVPAPDFNGAVSIGFSSADAAGNVGAPSTVAITVTPVNDAPIVGNELVSTPINSAVTVTVLANDRDAEGGPLTVSNPVLSSPSQGSVSVNADGTLTFTPATNVSGPVTITYTVSDAEGGSTTATLTVNVGSNTAPDSVDRSVAGVEDTPLTLGLAHFSFIDADAAQGLNAVRIDSLPAAGQLLLGGVPVSAGTVVSTADIEAGRLSFVPAANANGAPYGSFNFSVQDSAGAFDTTPNTLTLNIAAANDAPVAGADSATATEDTPLTGNVLANDSDVDGDALSVTGFTVSGVAGSFSAGSTAAIAGVGTLSIAADGSYSFAPAPHYNGPVPTATYTVTDGTTATSATLSLIVTAVNDAPETADVAAMGNEDALITVTLSGTDVDGAVNGFVIGALPANGTLYADAGGSFALAAGDVVTGPVYFRPAANFNGSTSFQYAARDNSGATDATPAIATITVTPVNDAPVANADARSLGEDAPSVSGNVITTGAAGDVADTDVDGDALTVSGVSFGATVGSVGSALAGAYGSLTLNANGSYTYVPSAAAQGLDDGESAVEVFTYSITDGHGGTTTTTLTVTVTGSNDAPTVVSEVGSTPEDTPVSGNVLANDSDVDGEALSVSGFTVAGVAGSFAPGATASIAGVGTLSIAANGAFTFTPAANHNGAVPQATYTVTDGTTSATGTLSLSVTPVNDAPIAVNDAVITAEDTAVVINVLGNDSDVDGPALAVTQINGSPIAVGSPVTLAQGSVALNADGTLTFTPNANFNGPVSFGYTVSDGSLTASATVSVSVAAVNDAPAANNDTASTAEDTPLTLTPATLLGNDTDADGNTLTIASVQGAINGTVALVAGNVVFTPAANYNGPASFTYTVSDGQGGSSTATVNVTVNAVNDTPGAVADTGSTPEDTAVAGNVLANDSDVEGSALAVTQFTVAGVAGIFAAGSTATLAGIGSLSIAANGDYSFAPAANYNGAVPQVTYTVSDGNDTSTATFTLNVTPVNDAPLAAADTGSTSEDAALNIGALAGVLGNDGDVEGDTLSVSGISFGATSGTVGTALAGTHGTLTLNADGSYSYVPGAAAQGLVAGQSLTDQFSYTVSDGNGGSATATLTLTIQGADDAPAITGPLTGTVTEDGTTAATGALTISDADAGQSSFVAQPGTAGTYGSFTLTSAGTWTYTLNNGAANVQALNPGQAVNETFTITTADGSTRNVVVSVHGSNDQPIALIDTGAVNEDATLNVAAAGGVLANDSDVDSAASLTATGVRFGASAGAIGAPLAGSYGQLTLNADGSYVYVANNANALAQGQTVTEVFEYTVADGQGGSTTQTLTVTVTGANDAPVTVGSLPNATRDDSTAVSLSTAAGFADVDAGDTLSYSASGLPSGLSINATTGLITGMLAANASQGGPYSIAVTATDSHGVTVTQSFTLTVNNPAPTAVADTAQLGEDAANVSGSVTGNDNDVDGDALSVTGVAAGSVPSGIGNVGSAVTGGYGSVVILANGSYTYTPGAAAQALIGGQSVTDTFTYTVSDGNGGTATTTLTITINGADDAPAITGPLTGTVTEDGTTVSTGTLNISDADAGQSSFIAQGGTPGAYGSFAITAAGAWTYTLNNAAANVQALAQGQSVSDSFTVTTADGTTRTVTITVNGTNDAPVAVADSGAVNEDAALNVAAAAGVLGNDSDVDTGATRSVTGLAFGATAGVVGTSLAGSYGHLTLQTDGSYVYVADTANALRQGQTVSETFSYTVTDDRGAAATTTLSITVTGTNDTPVAVGTLPNVTRDDSNTVSLPTAAGFADADTGDTLSYSASGLPAGLTINAATGVITGTLAANASQGGPYSITVTAADAQGGTVSQNFTLSVNNPAPTAAADTDAVSEDAAAETGNVLGNDADPDGDTLVVTGVAAGSLPSSAGQVGAGVAGAYGSLTLQANGSYSYAPGAAAQALGGGQTATDTFTYTISDGNGGTASATLTVTLQGVNDAPVAVADVASTPINTAITIDVKANDSDPDNTAAQLVVSNPVLADAAQGTVSVNPDGTLSFTPAANVTGAVTITYTLTDPAGLSSSANVTVNVGANTAPTGADFTRSIAEDTSLTLATADFGFADADAAQTLGAVRIDALPSNGSLLLNGSAVTAGQVVSAAAITAGQLVFVPDANEHGNPYASFTFSVQDSAGAFDTTPNTATLQVTPVNDPPVASDDIRTTAEDTPIVIDVLGNDSDADGDALGVTQINGSPIAVGSPVVLPQGTVALNASGTLTFTPAGNFNGPLSFTYTVSDGAATDTATVNLNVTAVNDAPVALADLGTADQNTTLVVSAANGVIQSGAAPAGRDSDVDGDTLSVSGVSFGASVGTVGSALAGAYGSLTLNANGSYTYVPSAAARALDDGESAVEVFTYSITDGNGGTATTTLTVTVTGSNDAPTVVSEVGTTPEDTPVSGNVLTNDSDVDVEALSISGFTVAGGAGSFAAGATASIAGVGTLSIAANGAFTFTPAANYNGPVPQATYTVTDGTASATGTLSLSVTPVNDAPDTANVSATGNEDTLITVTLSGSDIDGTVSGFVVSTLPANGTLYSDAAGTLAITAGDVVTGPIYFRPAANFNGSTSFQYAARDNSGATDATPAIATITVTPVNDAPIAVADTNTTNEDTAATGNVLGNDSDVEGSALTVTQFTVAGIAGSFAAGATASIAGVGTLSIAANGDYTFTPAANFNGAVPQATYTVSDGSAASTATLDISVTPVNDAPTNTLPGAQTTAEDTVLVFSTTNGNAITVADVDGGLLTTTVSVTNGTLNVLAFAGATISNNGSGTVTVTGTAAAINGALEGSSFNPAADYHGGATLSVATTDGTLTDSDALGLTVSAVADIANDSISTSEDTAVTINVLGNDSFESAGRTITAVNGTAITAGGPAVAVANGTVSLDALGQLTFTPAANYNNTAASPTTFSYTVSSGGNTETATVAVIVNAVNDVPVAGNDAATTNEDTPLSIPVATLLLNDIDADGHPLTITSVQGAVNGTVALVGGNVVFTPTADYNGPASFTYTVSDGQGGASTATVNVTVNPVADAPVHSVPAAQTTAEDTPLVFSNANGNAVTVADADGGSLTTTIAVTNGTLTLGSTAGVTVTGNGTGSVQLTGTAAAINAALNGTSYTNTADYNGPATLTVTTTDGAASDVDTVALTVTAVADIAGDSVTTNEDTAVTISVLANDSFENAGRTITAVNGTAITAGGAAVAVANGSVTLNAVGQLTFTPDANYNGNTSFTYIVTSGGVTETATVNVTVDAVNDAPVNTTPGAQTTAEDTALVFSSANGNAITVADLDGGSLTTTIAVSNGTLTLGSTAGVTVVGNGTGSVQITGTAAAINAALNGTSYASTADYNGPATLTVTTTDGAASDVDAVALTVTAVADIAGDSVTTDEDTAVTISVLANDTFENAGRSITAVNGSAITAGGPAVAVGNGTVSLNASGQLTFTPTANYNGPASFTYTVSSGGTTEIATVNVTVNAVNDGPQLDLDDNDSTAAGANYSASYTENGAPISIGDVDVRITDLDNTTLAGATITLTNLQPGDVLGVGALPAGITATASGANSITLSGNATLADYEAAIRAVTFSNSSDNPSTTPRTIQVSVNDGALGSNLATTTINVVAVNDAPVAVADTASTNEDTQLSIPVATLLLNDTDAEGNPLTITSVQGAVNGTVALVGGNVTFTPNANYNGPASFTYTISDGQGGTSTTTVNVTVNAVNDAPVNTLPGAQATTEDTALVFSAANGNAITVADVDGGTLTTTVSVTNGTLTALAFAGATISNNGSGTVTISGTAAAVNGALNGLSFNADADSHGGTTLTVTTTDGTATDTDTLALTVSPVTDIADDSATTNEDTAATISPLLNDSFEDTGRSITAVNGTAITAGGPAVAVSDGTVSLNASGQLIFTPSTNYNGAASFTYTVSAGGTTETATVTVTVNAVNDAPVNTTPGALATAEDTPLVFSDANGNAITVADVDGGSLTTTIAVSNGTLTLGSTAGVTVVGNGTGSVQITGTAAAINAALNGTGYASTADYNGTATLTVTTTDGAASDVDTVALTVTAVADIAGDSVTTNEDTPITISVLANDSFENAGRSITAVDGSPIAAGGPAVAVGNGTVTLNASGQLTFTPTANYNGPASFTYTVTSGGVTETATVNVSVDAVNDAPVNTVPGAQATTEDTPLVFSSANGNAITVADVDGGSLTTTIAVTNGTLTLGSTAGVTVVGNGTGSVQIIGTAAAINAALNGTSFTNTADYNGPATLTVTTTDGTASDVDTVALTVTPVADIAGDTGITTSEDTATTISVLANDSFENTGRSITAVNGSAITAGGPAVAVANGSVTLNASGQLIFTPATNYNGPASFTYTVTSGGTTETATVNITVSAVNDAPVNTTPGAQTTTEDTALVFSSANGNAITVADVDGGSLTTTIAVSNGTLTLGSTAGVTVIGNGTGSVQITGTAAAINAALNGTSYANTADYNGPATLTVTTTDGAASDVDTVALTVTAVADIADDTATTNEDTAVTISALANDSFENAGRTITAVNGSAITAGGPAVAVANGSVALNTSGQLIFTPAADYNNTVASPTSFNYTVASGGVAETATVSVTVNAINDAPVNTTPGAQTTAEDAALVFSSANGNAITVADVDGGSLTTTIAVSNGTLTLGSTAGVTVVGNGTGSVQITGTAAAINAALNGTSYTNTADYNGPATLTVTTTDGAASDVDTVALTVTAVADIAGDSVTTNEDTAVTISVLANDSFENAGRSITAVDGSPITAGGPAVAVANGTVSLNVSGQLTFTPTANYNGPASFTYTVSSGGTTEIATVNVTVNAVNDGPQLDLDDNDSTAAGANYSASYTENGAPISIGDVDVRITDLDNTTLAGATITLTNLQPGDVLGVGALPAGITATASGANSITLSGNATLADYEVAIRAVTFSNSSDNPSTTPRTIQVSVNDGALGSNLATTTINVVAVNDAPVAVPAAASGLEDAAFIAVNLSGTDVDGTVASVQVTVLPANGTLFLADGVTQVVAGAALTPAQAANLRFVPAADFGGNTQLSFTVTDNQGLTSAVAVNPITVTPVADQPTVAAWTTSQVNVSEDWQDGNTSVGSMVWTSSDGVVEVGAQSVFNGVQNPNTALTPANNRVAEPEADAGTANWIQTTVNASLAGQVLEISFDTIRRTLTGSADSNTQSFDVIWNGTVVGTYNPTAAAWVTGTLQVTSLAGANTLRFQPTDQTGSIGSVLDNIAVRIIADGQEDTAVRLPSLAGAAVFGDIPDNSEQHTLSLTAIPVGATVSDGTRSFTATAGNTSVVVYNEDNPAAASGGANWNLATLTVTPPSNFNGSMALTVTASAVELANGSTATASSTINLTIAAVNDAPVASASLVTGVEDQLYTYTLANFSATDVDGSIASVTITSLPVSGDLYFNGVLVTTTGLTVTAADFAAGRLQFRGDANESGSDGYANAGTGDQRNDYASFSFTVTDNQGATSNTATMTVDVTPVADATTITAASTTLPAGTGLTRTRHNLGSNLDATSAQTLANIEPAVEGTNAGQTIAVTGITQALVGGLADDRAYRVSGFVYLVAGSTYSFSGTYQDTLTLEIGGQRIVGAAQVGNTTDNESFANADFTPAVSGFYSVELITYSVGAGGFASVNVSVNGAAAVAFDTTNFNLHPTASTITSSSAVGAFVSATDTNTGGTASMSQAGYYQQRGAAVVQGEEVQLPSLTAAFGDAADNSERHTVTLDLSGAPIGTRVFVDSNNDGVPDDGRIFIVTAGNTSVVIFNEDNPAAAAGGANWSLNNIAVDTPDTYTGSFTLNAVSRAEEVVNGAVVDTTTSTLPLPITVVGAANLAPSVSDTSANVSEEGLATGVADTTGTPDTTNSATVSGTVSIADTIDSVADSITSVTLLAPGTTLTSNGVAITWSGAGTGTLVGTAGGSTIATLTIDNTGAYTFALSGPIDHAVAGAEDALGINFGVVASDGVNSGTGTLTINVEDDSVTPLSPITAEMAVTDTNLEIVLDVSGSMTNASGIPGMDRLEAAVQSISTLLDRYDEFGTVAVRLVTFSSTAAAVGATWMTVADAKAALASLVASGGTNYDAALNTAQTAFATTAGRISGAQNVAYFFSDGAPNAGTEIGAADETTWTTFLDNNQMRAFAIGMGTGVPQAPMDPIAYNGQNNEAANAVVVTDLSQLDSVLAGTIQNPVAGPLVTGGSFGAGALLGADGGDIRSVTVDGTTYTYDPSGGGSIAASGGTDNSSFDTTSNTLTITTAAGGQFTLDMDNGNYRYSAPGSLSSSIVETMDYVIADHDGDTQASSLSVNVDRTNVMVGTTSSESISGTGNADLVIARQGDDIIVGGTGRDTLLGGAGSDQLSGGDGDDVLLASVGADTLDGGAAADRLNGGAGNDQLTGGLGADVFAWQFVDRGTGGSPAADIITDFNVATPASGGDTLDLRDLLQSENTGNLAQFLDFDTTSVPGSTIIRISSGGTFAGGTYSAAAEDQRITLQGVDLRSSLGLGGGATDDQIIQELLNRGKLITD